MSQSSSDRIVSALEKWIAAAPAGAKLPASRALVADYGASPVTVQQALRVLAERGLVEARPGVGTFVLATRTTRPHDYRWQTAALGSNRRQLPEPSAAALRTPPNDVISLHSGYPDRALLPERLVRGALTRAARGEGAFSRPPIAGLPDLQAWFAGDLGKRTPAGINPPTASDVVIVPGSQSGLAALFRTLVGPGGQLIVESPTYWGAISAAAQAGVDLIPVSSGPAGPNPDDVDRALAETGARVFYAQPTYANPTGAQWSRELAAEILDVVVSRGAFLIEDDWAHDFAMSSQPSPIAVHDDGGHVIYLRSLTKSVSPAIRVAGIIARGPARDRVLADVAAQSMYVSGALQAAALDVVTQPAWRTHLRTMQAALASRRDLMVESLRTHAPSAHLDLVPDGGLNLWLQLPDHTDLAKVVRDCESDGLIVAAGDGWFPTEATGRFLRLNYSGPNPGAFDEAARILGRRLGD
jgi:DNA-binding transcriptional MocR family regulator